MNENIRIKREHPYLKASQISRLFYCWLNGILKKGKKKKIEEEDLFDVLHDDSSEYICKKLEKQWNTQLLNATKNKKPSLAKAIFNTYGLFIFTWSFIFIFEEAVRILQPFLIGRLIRYFTQDTTNYFNKNHSNHNNNNNNNYYNNFSNTFNNVEIIGNTGNPIDNADDQPTNNTSNSLLSDPKFHAYMYALGVCLCSMVPTIVHHPFFLAMFRLGMRLRVACCALVYKKSLRLSTSSLGKTAIGQMVNLMSNDVLRFEMTTGLICYLMVGPMEVVAVGIILWFYIGWGVVAGMFILLMMIPFTGGFAKLFAILRSQITKLTDKRLSQMIELLHGMRLVKMSCWEGLMEGSIMRTRSAEIKRIIKVSFARAAIVSPIFYSGKLIIFFTFLTYVLLGNEINAEIIFVTMSLYNPVRHSMTLSFPMAMQFGAECMVTIRRLQEFLLLPEKENLGSIDDHPHRFADGKGDTAITMTTAVSTRKAATVTTAGRDGGDVGDGGRGENGPVGDIHVTVKDVTLTWDYSCPPVLSNLSFKVGSGELLMVVGRVGVGKTALLMMILKELPILTGQMDVYQKLAYASQQAWVFNASIRRNILLGSEYDRERYEAVLKCCGLKEDLSSMPYGDGTHVGDRGATLSGGQRARVSLARAIYSSADVFLLDDPLSAVDAQVSQHLFNECINGFLSNKLRILVTHQIQYLPKASKILLLNKDQNHLCGTYDDLIDQGVDFHKIINAEDDEIVDDIDGIQVLPQTTTFTPSTKNPLLSSLDSVLYIDAEAGDGKPDESILVQSSSSLSSLKSPYHPGVEFKSGSKSMMKMTPKKNSLLGLEETSPRHSIHHNPQEQNELAEEEIFVGKTVPASLYLEYLKIGTGTCGLVFLFILNILAQVCFLATDWWLVKWCNAVEDYYKMEHQQQQQEKYLFNNNTTTTTTTTFLTTTTTPNHPPKFPDNQFYLLIFTLLTFLVVLSGIVRAMYTFYLAVMSSHKLHKGMLHSIIHSPITFFDANPTGRILNRFSKDLGHTDETYPLFICDLTQNIFILIGIFIVITVVNPWVLIAIVVMFILFGLIRNYYLCTIRNVRRMESILKGPVFSHLSATFLGVHTIRSHGVEDLFNREFHELQDNHSSAFTLYLTLGRWFAVRLEWLCTGLICVVTFAAVLASDSMNGAKVGLSLSYVITLLWLFQWTIRQSTEVETLMTSVERIVEYAKLPVEQCPITAPTEIKKKTSEKYLKSSYLTSVKLEKTKLLMEAKSLPNLWPQYGGILFRDVCLRYKSDGPDVLKGLNFGIKPGEKVGIVGRTGAGKSSLMNVIFRLNHYKGAVLIDDVDIGGLDLFQVRKKISIIPQEPILLQGTLRMNLDLSNEHEDSDMWSVLERVKLDALVNQSNSGLDFLISESGGNLSVGQKQLLCLARALLRRNKILIIDEATANVDRETDSFIQKVLRNEFVECTVLCIAHRLSTVIDYDRIMLLDGGEIKEFDTPTNLLKNKDSIFAKLAQQTGTDEYQRLLQAVEIVSNDKKVK